jgi:hypothetical protein
MSEVYAEAIDWTLTKTSNYSTAIDSIAINTTHYDNSTLLQLDVNQPESPNTLVITTINQNSIPIIHVNAEHTSLSYVQTNEMKDFFRLKNPDSLVF